VDFDKLAKFFKNKYTIMEKKYYKLLSWIDMIIGGIFLILIVLASLLAIVSPNLFKPRTQSIYDILIYIFIVVLLILSGMLLFKKKEKYKRHRMKLKMLSILDVIVGFVIIIGIIYNLVYPSIITYSEFMVANIFNLFYFLLLFISGFILDDLSR